MIRLWRGEIAEAIYETEGAEFSCATKDFYYIMPKTDHFLELMTEVVKTESRVIGSFDEITEPCMKLAVYERGRGSGGYDPLLEGEVRRPLHRGHFRIRMGGFHPLWNK